MRGYLKLIKNQSIFLIIIIIIIIPNLQGIIAQDPADLGTKNLRLEQINAPSPSYLKDGEEYNIIIEFRNNGSSSIDRSFFIYVYIDDDYEYLERIDYEVFPNITYSFNVSYDSSYEKITVDLDTYDQIKETDETDNIDYIQRSNTKGWPTPSPKLLLIPLGMILVIIILIGAGLIDGKMRKDVEENDS